MHVYSGLVIVLVGWLLLDDRVAHGEQVGLQPVPTLLNVQVEAQCSFDSSSGLYTYSYTINNPATNTGQIRKIDLDISQPFRERIISSEGLTIPFGVNTLTFDEVLAIRRSPDPMVPVGMRVPPGWRGGLSPTGFAFSGSTNATGGSDKVAPGETQGGFQVISRGMPAIRQIEVTPYWVLILDTEEDYTPEVKKRAREVEEALPFKTNTLGPSWLRPGSVEHWDRLKADLNQTIQLGWILDRTLGNTLLWELASAKQAWDAGDKTLTRTLLDKLMQTVQQASATQRRREVSDLVVLNVQRLVEAISRPR